MAAIMSDLISSFVTATESFVAFNPGHVKISTQYNHGLSHPLQLLSLLA